MLGFKFYDIQNFWAFQWEPGDKSHMAKDKTEIRFKVVYQGLPCEVLAEVIGGIPKVIVINVEGDCLILPDDLDDEGRMFFEESAAKFWQFKRNI